VLYAKVDCNLDMNPKIRKAGNLGRQVFEFLIRRNRALDSHGFVPAGNVDPDYLADMLMVTRNDAVTGVTAAVTAKLISVTASGVAILGWSDEWGREPKSNAERQAAFRRKARGTALLEGEPIEAVTESNEAKVTSNTSNVREEKRREEIERGGVAVATDLAPPEPQGPKTQSGGAVRPIRNTVAMAARELAAAAVDELNRLTGRALDPEAKPTLADAARLIAAGYTAEQATAVVRAKHAQWRADDKMAAYLKPSVLLRPSNFGKYLAEDVPSQVHRPMTTLTYLPFDDDLPPGDAS
jgi:uncharacterized phage protein (TIGR02220 family)